MSDTTSTMRTDYCGELGLDDQGRQVAVCGWVNARREHSAHLAFIDVRDRTGLIQCVVDGAHDLRNEYVVRVVGTVTARTDETVNPKLATGEVELVAEALVVESAAETLPLQVNADREYPEDTRLRYRFLDLRREAMHRNILLRSRIISSIRRRMSSRPNSTLATSDTALMVRARRRGRPRGPRPPRRPTRRSGTTTSPAPARAAGGRRPRAGAGPRPPGPPP